MAFWGSAGESAEAAVDGVRVEVDVAVNEDDLVRIAAWTDNLAVNVEIVFTAEEAARVRDLLSAALNEGRWLA